MPVLFFVRLIRARRQMPLLFCGPLCYNDSLEDSLLMKTPKLYAPRTGFGRLMADLVRRYYVHDVARDSAALTYYLLFAIFPLLIFVSALLGVLELDIDSITAVLAPLLPSDVVAVVRSYLDYVAANRSRQLLWFSLIFSIWFPMRSTGCLMHSLRKAFGRSTPENILLSQLRTLLFTVWMIFVIGLTLALVVVGRRALLFLAQILPLSDAFISVWGYLRFIILGLVMAISLGLLYQLALGQRRPLREVLPGVGSSLAAWMVLSMAFSYYVENVASYARLYGSIATIVVVLLWLYMSGQVLILGAELSAALTHLKHKRHAAPPSGGEEEA